MRDTIRMAGILFGMGLALLMNGTALAADAANEEMGPRIDALLADWDRPDTPGVAAAVLRRGDIQYSAGVGRANLAHGVGITPETRFNAGSVAKMVTAAAIVTLAGEDALSVTDSVREYIPDLPDYAGDVTLRHLLTHTSGFRDFLSLTFLAGWQPDDVRTRDQALRLINRQGSLDFEPGESFIYSNTNYILLAEVIEAATGRAFADWVAANLLSPAGMDDSLFLTDHRRVVPRLAESYRRPVGAAGFRRDPVMSDVAGSGNLVTTAADLAQWGAYLMQAEVAGTPLLTRLSDVPDLPGTLDSGYGAGLFVDTYRGLEIRHHGGTTAGFNSHLLVFPGPGAAVAVLGNGNTVPAERLAHRIADIVLADSFPEPEPARAGAGAPETVEKAAMVLPLDAYAGLYLLENGMVLSFRVVEDTPLFWLGSEVPRRLVSAGDHTFRARDGDARIVFSAGGDGAVESLTVRFPNRALEGRPVPAAKLSAREARAYEGRYYSPDLDTFYRIEGDDGGLVMRHLRGTEIRLTPIGNDQFVEARAPDLIVRFRRNRFDRVRRFEISVQRARNIVFEKE